MSSPAASCAYPGTRAEDLAWRERSARLYSDLRAPAMAMVRRAFGSAFGDEDLEDIYGGAWLGTLRTLERRHAELSDAEIRRYLLTAVAHQASKELRRRRRRPTAPLEKARTVADTCSTPDERADQSEQSRITRDLLAPLPGRTRAVLMLRYGWGLEPSEVCGLIDGLSPPAYRKEITRGVERLAENLRLLEQGEWCAEREPVLRAFAAGIADPDQQRQAQQHLSHCRHCSDFVGKLSGYLHEAGASLALPVGLDGVRPHLSLGERIAELADRTHDSIANAVARRASEASEAAVLPAAGTRGAGTAGAGLVAKLAGLCTGGKAAVACLSGGAAAAVCFAAGMGSIGWLWDGHRDGVVGERPVLPHMGTSGDLSSPLPSQVGHMQPASPTKVDDLDQHEDVGDATLAGPVLPDGQAASVFPSQAHFPQVAPPAKAENVGVNPGSDASRGDEIEGMSEPAESPSPAPATQQFHVASTSSSGSTSLSSSPIDGGGAAEEAVNYSSYRPMSASSRSASAGSGAG